MRPVVRGDWPTIAGQNIQYNRYQNARAELISRIGEYCSYCEMHLDASLAIEHMQPKKPPNATTNQANTAERESNWFNFLLACSNCNSIKANVDVVLDNYLWPDRDNTFAALTYHEGGVVKPNTQLPLAIQGKAQATIELTGLDRTPLHDSAASDRRWDNRRETWDMAKRAQARLITLQHAPQAMELIVDQARAKGYWSIWMTVFANEPPMRKRLIEAFEGTCQQCFDENDNYSAIARENGAC